MSVNVEMSPEQLQKILEAVVSKVQALNPLDQRKYDEILRKERRRDDFALTLGAIEKEKNDNIRRSCSHLRYPATAGKLSGHVAPVGYPGAEWRTGGQAYQNGLAMMLCLRCGTQWWFRPTPEYYTVLLQNGLDNTAPPPDDHCICIGCFELKNKCKCEELSQEHAAAHPTVPVAV
jgi:hypothetical protein